MWKQSHASNGENCNYVFTYTTTESTAGVTIAYIANNLAYKPRTESQIYKNCYLGCIFIELNNLKKGSIIIVSICRHPDMGLNDFQAIINQVIKE